ncbi:MAG TPA: 4-hydroxythreonine-4-phosphate dehydrogenase PdxA [Chthoniobacterales bacterium]
MGKIRLAITLGDTAGIGPEVVRAALKSAPPDVEIRLLGELPSAICGQPTAKTARSAVEALEEAARLAISGGVDGVVTGPVGKHQLYEAGFRYPGQTEFFAARAGVENFAMCLTGGGLTVALVTVHEPLSKVPGMLRREEIVRVGKLLADHLRQRGIALPRIAVAGLNPHAGEGGAIGCEEIDIIAPATSDLKESRETIYDGPFSPDIVFHQAVRGAWDGVLCMYHDQGLIPLKLHAFDEGVNVTLGLPFVRTSPDHGTAFSIAGKGIANPSSMIAAINLAVALIRGPSLLNSPAYP